VKYTCILVPRQRCLPAFICWRAGHRSQVTHALEQVHASWFIQHDPTCWKCILRGSTLTKFSVEFFPHNSKLNTHFEGTWINSPYVFRMLTRKQSNLGRKLLSSILTGNIIRKIDSALAPTYHKTRNSPKSFFTFSVFKFLTGRRLYRSKDYRCDQRTHESFIVNRVGSIHW
jgi:hypothetical protein